jgi:hypothetical protein
MTKGSGYDDTYRDARYRDAGGGKPTGVVTTKR